MEHGRTDGQNGSRDLGTTRARATLPSRNRSRGHGRPDGQGQLDIEMESALRPREIQTRIRAGESVDDVARAAGVPVERIEPYAAPVLAEREHIAGLAQRGSARRRGENSGHRELRSAVAERLGPRGIDPETVRWDSFRMDDGRWAVSASYDSGEAGREAVFYFDQRGRFSVAGNDEARWVLGEQSPLHGPQPGRRRPVGGEDPDSEPTLDLHDELALVRAVQDAAAAESAAPSGPSGSDEPDGSVGSVGSADEPGARRVVVTEEVVVETVVEAVVETGTETAPTEDAAAPHPVDDASDENGPVDELDEASELDLLYDMLGGAGYTEDSGRVYPGLSDAPAEPGPAATAGWEPGVVINYPIEPEPEPSDGSDEHVVDDVTGAGLDPRKVRTVTEPTLVDSDPVETHSSDDTSQEEEDAGLDEGSGQSDAPGPEEQTPPELPPAPGGDPDGSDAATEDAVPESTEAPAVVPPEIQDAPDRPGPSDDPDGSSTDSPPDSPSDTLVDAPAGTPPTRPARKRKRAEVPSWDEIMFGGPKRN